MSDGFYSREVSKTSETDQWATPQAFFDLVNSIYQFTLDVCAEASNAKCADYFTPEQDGLKQEWRGSCWMNPPYGRTIGAWMKKAYESARNNHATVACLVPARTDTRWWHEWAMKAQDIYLVKGRLKFGDSPDSAPFPSALVVFHPNSAGDGPKFHALEVNP